MIAGGFKLLFGDTNLRFFWILYTANLIFESNSIGVLVWLLREAFEGLIVTCEMHIQVLECEYVSPE